MTSSPFGWPRHQKIYGARSMSVSLRGKVSSRRATRAAVRRHVVCVSPSTRAQGIRMREVRVLRCSPQQPAASAGAAS